MTWKDAVRHELRRYAEKKDSQGPTLQRFYDFAEDRLAAEYPDNNHLRAKIRQVLQQLRDQNEIAFVDDAGRYKLEESEENADVQEEIEILDDLESDFDDL
jgi:putative restriction endonuclease